MNFASRAARELNERIPVATPAHVWFDIAPDPQDSTRFLESLSVALLREKFPRRRLFKFPAGEAVRLSPPPGFPGGNVSPNHPCHGRPEGKDVA